MTWQNSLMVLLSDLQGVTILSTIYSTAANTKKQKYVEMNTYIISLNENQ